MKGLRLILISFGLWIFIGCSGEQNNKVITYNSDIAPIINQHCISCHQPGFIAPFPLTNYSEVKRKAKTIVDVTRKRIMPPWPADPSYSHFVGENILTENEVSLINEWYHQGCKEGTSAIKKSTTIISHSYIGKPDLTLKVPVYNIKNDDRDRFVLMKIPYEIERDTFVRAVEFIPGSRYVHHVNGHLISYNSGDKKNVNDGRHIIDMDSFDVKTAYNKLSLAYDNGSYPLLTPSFVNYLPGVTPAVYPSDIGGFRLSKKGAIFFKDIHFGPSAKSDTDTSYINLFFTDKPPARPLKEFQMGTLGQSPVVPHLEIGPNEIKTFRTELRIPVDISLVTVNPHMHLIGRSFLAYALTPSNDTIKLIRINNWDFRWQYFYTYPKMIKIPAGSVIRAEGIYDNTNKNPFNPYNPPRTISGTNGSMKATDEMFQFIVNYVPYKQGDEFKSLKE